MKFSLSWLKRHLDTTADLATICDALTDLGLEVEGIEDPASRLQDFTVAYVKEANKHPDADRLKVCVVETIDGGKKVVCQVVCGAPNARAGIKVAFAAAGVVIPVSGQALKVSKIRGQDSNGMLCSGRELLLSDESDGIMELPEDTKVGQPLAEALGLDDAVIEIALTPNRPDCAGVRGIARDLASRGLGRLKPLEIATVSIHSNVAKALATIAPEAAKACPKFLVRHITGVKNCQSPEWLQTALKAVGMRSISALVDITNFMVMDEARPLHVFDASKVSGALNVHLSAGGETFLGLKEVSYTLPSGAVVISDDNGIQSLAGIMGGLATGCTPDTTDVILESAYFDPSAIARTGRALQIMSDARYRFERGIDCESALAGLERATALILEICGGKAGAITDLGAGVEWQRHYTLRQSRVRTLGGVEIALPEQQRILESLGFTVVLDGENFTVNPPPWRPDICGEEDLVEELVRVYGLDRVAPVALVVDKSVQKAIQPIGAVRASMTRRVLSSQGLSEAVTWSFMDSGLAQQFAPSGAALPMLANPLNVEWNALRPSIVPNLAGAVVRNHMRGYPSAALFEVGPVFYGALPEQQTSVAAGVRCGNTARHWASPSRGVDVFDAKADVFAVLAGLGFDASKAPISIDAPSWYHPKQSGVLRLGKTVLATFGTLHPSIVKQLDYTGAMVAFEVFLEAVPFARNMNKPLQLSVLQPVRKDLALVVANDVAASDVLKAVQSADTRITEVSVFDVYQGANMPEGQKSLAISLTLQPEGDISFTDTDLDAVLKAAIAKAAAKTGAKLRA